MLNISYKKLQPLYIFVSLLANQDFWSYVRSGRWVGEVSQNNVRAHEKGRYVCANKEGSRWNGFVNQYQSVSDYFISFHIPHSTVTFHSP